MKDKAISDNELNNIIFGTLYKRKISLKDWLYTKNGFIIFVYTIYLISTDGLSGQMIAIVLAISLYLYNKDTTLAHEKEDKVWLIKFKKDFVNQMEEMYLTSLKKKSMNTESKKILEMCKIKPILKKNIPKTKRKKRIKKKNAS